MKKQRAKKLTENNYYSKEQDLRYFSVSQFKDFMKCEAMAMAKIRGEYKQPLTRPMLIGSFVDSYFEGTLEQFKQENPEIFTMKNELRAEFRKANEIIKKVSNDPVFSKFMSGDKQKILTWKMFGTDWKAKLDSFSDNICITDLKITQNFKSVPFWRYDIQGAVYQKAVEIALKQKLPFYLAIATKEKIIDFDVFQIPQSILDEALSEVEMLLPRFIAVKKGNEPAQSCGVCDYCKSLKTAKIRSYAELL